MKLRDRMIEHLKGEVQWWEGSGCPKCCVEEVRLGCLYHEAKRLLEDLTREPEPGDHVENSRSATALREKLRRARSSPEES